MGFQNHIIFSFSNFIEPIAGNETNFCGHNSGIVDIAGSKHHSWLLNALRLLWTNHTVKLQVFRPCVSHC